MTTSNFRTAVKTSNFTCAESNNTIWCMWNATQMNEMRVQLHLRLDHLKMRIKCFILSRCSPYSVLAMPKQSSLQTCHCEEKTRLYYDHHCVSSAHACNLAHVNATSKSNAAFLIRSDSNWFGACEIRHLNQDVDNLCMVTKSYPALCSVLSPGTQTVEAKKRKEKFQNEYLIRISNV